MKKYIKKRLTAFIQRLIDEDNERTARRSPHDIDKYTLRVRNFDFLAKAMGWDKRPKIDTDQVDIYNILEDLNERPLRDMQVILGACANKDQEGCNILEIGTAYGQTTKYMSENAPNSTIYTINIPPEKIEGGGDMVTYCLSHDEIGREYKKAGCQNVVQILENTLHWNPKIDPIDVALIDGCHDPEFVYQDTVKVLSKCKKGSIILWHDFNPDLVQHYDWVKGVCTAVVDLYEDGHLTNKVLHLQDSYVGLYVV